MKFLKRFLQSRTKNAPTPNDSDVFNVENFNAWFCDPNNNAIYANKGIFLRLDKLSESQISDYLDKRWGIKNCDYDKIRNFSKEIRENWLELNNT